MMNEDLSKKLISIVFKLTIVLLIVSVVSIVYSQREKLDSFKIKNNSYKENVKITYTTPSNTFVSQKKDNNINNFIACYEKPMKEEDFTDEMKNKLNEIYSFFSNNQYILSFSYEDMYSGLHVSYNENQQYFAASTIKAPVVLYTYEQAEAGNIDLDSYMTYTPVFFVEGSGSLQYTEFGSSYTIRELSKKAIIESDNVAYQMVAASANINDIMTFWQEKGSNNFWTNGIWGIESAYDFSVYMKELYKYFLTKSELSEELMNYFYNSVFPLIKSGGGETIAHKSGWRGDTMHDAAIVFDEYPYVVAIFSNRGASDYNDFFDKASLLIYDFHKIYWKSKANYCYTSIFKA